jgi:hypothetical protein
MTARLPEPRDVLQQGISAALRRALGPAFFVTWVGYRAATDTEVFKIETFWGLKHFVDVPLPVYSADMWAAEVARSLGLTREVTAQ